MTRRRMLGLLGCGILAGCGGPPPAGSERRKAASSVHDVLSPYVERVMLIEDGKLKLDEPVSGLLPELAAPKVLRRLESPLDDVVPARRAITLRDLLTFRMGSGLLLVEPSTYPILKAHEERLGDGMPSPGKLVAPDEWMRRFGTLPLMHQPGERWMYNTSALALGVLRRTLPRRRVWSRRLLTSSGSRGCSSAAARSMESGCSPKPR